uniref:Peptidase S1 domain-containing protein n=1 Tax=Strigamia maritima TaxID=126957 RepID=T1JFL4_STRMM
LFLFFSLVGAPSPVLIKLEVQILNKTDCKERLGTDRWWLTNTKLCGWSFNRNACEGDSGGPVVRRDGSSVIGIISFSVDCGTTNVPSIYTRVSKFNRWILNNTADHPPCVHRSKRVVGGFPASADSCPHIALLSDEDGYFRCGAVIISDKYLLTTHLCLDSYEKLDEIVLHPGYGIPGHNDAIVAFVENVTYHPGYDSSELINNIAIIELQENLELNNFVRRACISNSTNLPSPLTATFCGYGVAEDYKHGELRQVSLDWIPLDECKRHSLISPSDDNFCTRTAGKAFCAGDQGGPLIWTSETLTPFVVGLASWTTCEKGAPEMFVKINFFYDWIVRTVPSSHLCIDAYD